jgi:His-Xaa-Ser system radical SAM maturase HxsC
VGSVLKLYSGDNKPLGALALPETAILRVTTNQDHPHALRSTAALLLEELPERVPDGFPIVLCRREGPRRHEKATALLISKDLSYLGDGDVVKVTPAFRVYSIYRRTANTNSLLVTERCNSYCVMCSQPPKDIDDSHLVDELKAAIPLFARDTKEIGITGGEPTLLGDRFFELVHHLKAYLPNTAVHVLSNGRRFQGLSLARRLAALRHPDLMLGIPVYSDVAAIHDFVVQADGAFDETIQGILNLKRCGVRVEIRVVLHNATVRRLPQLARFIARNLQFVNHVALMGLEITGFTRANLGALWIDPVQYQKELRLAVETLDRANVRTSIYNHQLCTLDPSIRKYAVRSISDWKNEYMPQCDPCQLKDECGGFFSSARFRYSDHIRPLNRTGEFMDATSKTPLASGAE